MIATQEELAKLTGIDRTTISAIENNRLFLSSPYALIFKKVLGCFLDDLYELVDTKEENCRRRPVKPEGLKKQERGGGQDGG